MSNISLLMSSLYILFKYVPDIMIQQYYLNDLNKYIYNDLLEWFTYTYEVLINWFSKNIYLRYILSLEFH